MIRRALLAGLAATTVLSACGASTDSNASGGATPGFIGTVTAAYDQQTGTTLTLPEEFADANLLVAILANDGPDSQTDETHAVFGGTSGLKWVRHAHVSARQDWNTASEYPSAAGASSAEVWTAEPPTGWTPGTVTEISNFPQRDMRVRDDGGIITVAAWSTGRLGQVLTVDGLNGRPEHQAVNTLGPASSIFAAVFNGRVNGVFTPVGGFHVVDDVALRAGDDTAQVIGADDVNLPAGLHDVGYADLPPPGDYWEMAIVEVIPQG